MLYRLKRNAKVNIQDDRGVFDREDDAVSSIVHLKDHDKNPVG
jgi:hypothetical protein